MGRLIVLLPVLVAALSARAQADQILFEETFDSANLPASLSYVADADFAWSVNGSHQLFADRSAATRGVATAISTEGFALPASGLLYSADMGTPNGADASSYNVGLVFGDYIALFHPGLTGGGGAFRLVKIEGAIDPREPALVRNTDMGFVPVQGSLHRVEAFVVPVAGALSIDVSITGLGTDGETHTFTHSFLDTSPGFGLGSVGVAMRGGSSPGAGDDGFFDNLTVRSTEPTPIPEPFTLALVGIGAGVIAWRKRRCVAAGGLTTRSFARTQDASSGRFLRPQRRQPTTKA